MSGIGIIANPHSKLNKRNPGRQQVLGWILGERGQLAVTNSLEHLSQVAREFRDRNISILAINGGDGTISRTLTAFIKEYGSRPLPQIVLLRGGTINVLAQNLGIKGKPEEVLYRLLQVHSSGKPIKTEKLATLQIEGNYGFLFGNATTARFLAEFYRNKTGPLGAVLLVLRLAFASMFNKPLYESVVASHEMVISADGKEPRTLKAVALMCSTIERGPLGFRLFPKARRGPHVFQSIAFVVEAEKLPVKLPLVVLRPGEGEAFGKISTCASTMQVTCADSKVYTIDGELYESASETIEIKPGPVLEFLVV